MNLDQQITKIASLIGDKTRCTILLALMEGGALTAGELSLRANISPQTASNHLKKLMEAGLIELVKTHARYRYYKITSPLVAKALESLSLLPPDKKRAPGHAKLEKDICFARTCYDHLAGKLGVAITNAFIQRNFISLQGEDFTVTHQGNMFFKRLGIDTQALKKLKRHFAKTCLDWTEREYHVAGSLANAFLNFLIENRLLIRSKQKSRVVLLTEKGRQWIKQHLAIDPT